MELLNDDKRTLFLPAAISFILALLLIYKFSFPISWDVYYHIHMAELYMQNGLVFWDNLTVAPKGRLIMYPPLFHIILAQISGILGVNPLKLCLYLQPLFSAYLIGIITFASYKLTCTRTALLTGFLSMFCFITFNRSVICTPATIALGLFLLSITYCYIAFKNESSKNIIVSSVALGLVWNLHMATAILTTGVIGLYFITQFIQRKWNIKFLAYYVIIVTFLGLPWWIYISVKYGLFFNSIAGYNTFLTRFFFRYYGIIPTILLIIGFKVLYDEKTDLSIFLGTGSLALLLLSQINLIGFSTVSIRILEVSSYVLIIISGIGLRKVYDKIHSVKTKNILLILLILLSVSSALLYDDSYTPDVLKPGDADGTLIDRNVHILINPVTTLFNPTVISSRYADSSLAHDRYDVMTYFINENEGMLVSEDAVMDTIIVSTSRTPVVYGGFTESIPVYVTDPVHIIKGWSDRNELIKLGITHILLNRNTPVPYYAEVDEENSHYKICKIRQEYRI